MKITPETVIRVSDAIEVSVSDGVICFGHGAASIRGGTFALLLLHVFGKARSYSDAMQVIGPFLAGKWSWIQLTTEIDALLKAGILTVDGYQRPSLKSSPGEFSGADVHIRMLNDRVRTDAFTGAMREVIRPGDTVVEIGTGTGVLTLHAVRCGARHVYTIEQNPNMARLAKMFLAQNGVAELVTVIEGRSTDVSIPEFGDVLVSETVGSDPLDERIISIFADARQRFLKPDARLIPESIALKFLPLAVPEDVRGRQLIGPAHVDVWKDWYGADLTVFSDASSQQDAKSTVPPYMARNWQRFHPGVPLVNVDLYHASSEVLRCVQEFRCDHSGFINGGLLCLEIALGGRRILSVHPDMVARSCSWGCVLWLASRGISVSCGDKLVLEYSYDNERRSSFSLRNELV